MSQAATSPSGHPSFAPALGVEHKGRMVALSGDPWFVGADVCRALGLMNTAVALRPLPANEKGITLADTLGGAQRVSIISESGLYRLTLHLSKLRADEKRTLRRGDTHDLFVGIAPQVQSIAVINESGLYRLTLHLSKLAAGEKRRAPVPLAPKSGLGATLTVRTMTIDGEPWFVAADVCRALGLPVHKGTFMHLSKLAADEKRPVPPNLIGGVQRQPS